MSAASDRDLTMEIHKPLVFDTLNEAKQKLAEEIQKFKDNNDDKELYIDEMHDDDSIVSVDGSDEDGFFVTSWKIYEI